jgi:hypothetical protein
VRTTQAQKRQCETPADESEWRLKVKTSLRKGFGLVPVVASIAAVLAFGKAAHAECPPGTPLNAIEAENCLTGNPQSEWDITGAGDPALQGFATNISVNRGETVSF